MDSIEKLKNIFRDFPTVGQRTAMRFVYYILKLPKEKTDELINAILELKNKIKLCQMCFNPFEGNNLICPICQNQSRNKNLLCIVEKESDLLSLENTRKYNGLYFILGGTLLRVEQLKKRIAETKFSEIIIALNPTPEGRATSILVEQIIKNLKAEGHEPQQRITHLAKGIPVGGELEYADEETLENALEGRK
ncbi:MAG: hypothetical protein A2358_00010 [Candidatus Staskawiczbacteria bacterium RIFOXYB1_FULL_37_44]|uniref:Recombination protein RecR n=1 Tax=Candidatus Staskawiczbacteria bacterium RIFOXYB1_FULL_37_44 TaxID=1802223 RepID=A0A1G2IXK3_9BACT|nr:MAG: hypothetical protein A2358_00010 [Candidatus Staskawiczbacteria bacterium RIFOXYB1_FULL_37_44]OGZ83738.1 MAG: hypothetical protein A2416_03995 [Candidatus Staskawiczbacteria bacterium RIFOXYC1_FULL_37_52]OGZ90268.1 MAG: hypothetical protein A2581_02530 [Candidatus Staskawiczbacteria bacterium RIFOXYD1_FULL_37_110]